MDVGLSGCGEKVQHGSPQIVRDRELFWFHFLLFVSFQTSKRGKKKQKTKTLYSAWSSQLHHWKPVVQEQQRLLLVAGCNIGLSWCVCVSGLRNIWNTAHPPLTLSHIYYLCLNPFFGLSCPAEGGVVLPTDVYIFCNHSHQKGLNSRPTPSRSFVQRQKLRVQNFTVQNYMVNWPPTPLSNSHSLPPSLQSTNQKRFGTNNDPLRSTQTAAQLHCLRVK